MHANGADHYAGLAARVDELEAAQALLVRRIETLLIPRLVEHDRDLDTLAAELARQTELLRDLTRELDTHRAAVTAAPKEADHG